MNGMIFAAGLGTRLNPITDAMPKALVQVAGKPLLWHAINHFYDSGIRHLVVNVHHFAHQVVRFLENHKWEGLTVLISDESDLLLDTGGGLVNAIPLFIPGQPVLVGNADVLSNAPLQLFMEAHQASDSQVSLMTMQRNSSRQLQFNDTGLLSGWINHETGEVKVARPNQDTHEAAFCGFHVIEQSFLKSLHQSGVFPIMDAYLDSASSIHIKQFNMPEGYFWFDVGTTKKLDLACRFMDEKT